MSNDNSQGDYEVGYGKPPKNTQFQKGISGNPRGRPKKSLDFDHELIKESLSLITITDNGQRKRISKFQGIAKQMTNKALAGSNQALRTYLAYLPQALERIALSEPQQSIESLKYEDPKNLTDEQLLMIVAADLEQKKQESGKEHLSNAEFIKSRALQLLPSSTLEE
jgi:hypothetical protein